jgi:hypothetical protein
MEMWSVESILQRDCVMKIVCTGNVLPVTGNCAALDLIAEKFLYALYFG